MKPLHLNLAARPYRDYRPVYAAVVVMSLLTAFLLLNNLDTYYRYVSETKATRGRIAQLDRQAAAERQKAQQIESQLKSVNTLALDRQTKFINAQLAERAFSWSELLDRLENVLPDDVRITSIAPTFQPNGIVHLELTCEAKSGQGLLQTINQMTRDPHFRNPFPHGEQLVGAGSYTFSLGVDFRPTQARVVVAQ
ncbi:MAG TPA: hypothetical protein VFL80_11675 [Thermoanaerobaculia bacterium]|nr:hypothetical protein [Thermoanaerobaculia bacterium]